MHAFIGMPIINQDSVTSSEMQCIAGNVILNGKRYVTKWFQKIRAQWCFPWMWCPWLASWSQFHQHFRRSIFCTIIFFGKKLLSQTVIKDIKLKLLVKCWWNWHLMRVTADESCPNSELFFKTGIRFADDRRRRRDSVGAKLVFRSKTRKSNGPDKSNS